MKAKDIIASKGNTVFSISENSTVHQAVEMLVQQKIGFLIVKDEYENVSGVFSERDVVKKCIASKKDVEKVFVREIMTKRSDITTGTETDELENLMNVMTEKKIRHIPILASERVIGIVSIGDIIKHILDAKESEIKTLSGYVAGNYPG